MIIAFSGWRGWTDVLFIQRQIDREWSRHATFGPLAEPMHFRVGDAAGADEVIREYLGPTSEVASLSVYVADWDRHGSKAGPIRNRDMLCGHGAGDPMYGHQADLLVAFPEPGRIKPAKNSGTWNAICQAHWRGIEVRIPGYRADIVPSGSDSDAQLELWAVPS
jgi:hypothetical protein